MTTTVQYFSRPQNTYTAFPMTEAPNQYQDIQAMCDQKPSGSRNKFDEFFQWSRLEKDFWWIPPNQKKEFCGVRLLCAFPSSPLHFGPPLSMRQVLRGLYQHYHK